jgi:RNA polymerase sigma-70 factor (ECF subfamily)
LSEQELINQILAGDEAAKTRFYNDHAHRLKPICVHFLGYQDPDIEDIVQQTFLIAYQKLGEFEVRASLYTWMGHICVNLCYDRLRQRKRVLASLHEDLEQLSSSLAHSREEEKERDNDQKNRMRIMEHLVKNMGEKCRKIIELRDFEGKSYAAVGKALKLPIGTVMSQLARCRETLKKLARHSLGEETP